jgi:hypothetical protein
LSAVPKLDDPAHAVAIEKVVLEGDLSRLTSRERLWYYHRLCQSLGVNPMTLPFRYLILDRNLVLYATKGLTDQLRANQRVSITSITTAMVGDCYVATACASVELYPGKGSVVRSDTDVGIVPVKGLTGAFLANAMMKAVTKAKRRVTLSLCGLGMYLDETELDTLPDARVVDVNPNTGEIEAPTAPEASSGAEIDAPSAEPGVQQLAFIEEICRAFDEAQTRDEANMVRLRWTQRPTNLLSPDLEALGTAAYQRARKRFPPQGPKEGA